jgi:hypothetical protein
MYFSGAVNGVAEDQAHASRTGDTCPRVLALFDDEGDSACRFGAGENLGTVGFAVHLEPSCQANNDILPRDVPAEVFLKLGSMIAGLKGGASLKPRFDGLLGGFDLLLELMETTATNDKTLCL